MKKKWAASLVLLVFLAFLASFIVNFLKEDDKPKVVVVVKRLDVEYWKIFESGAEKAFEDFDIDGQVVAPNSIYPITNEANTLKKNFKATSRCTNRYSNSPIHYHSCIEGI